MATDSDLAGTYAINSETRSRSGMLAHYDGMTTAWSSKFQQCKGTNCRGQTGAPIIALATAEAEIYAASEGCKMALHLKHICQEIQIAVPDRIPMGIDAGAAKCFIENTGASTKMKHIDLRQGWVKLMRDQGKFEFIKVEGIHNQADYFTKILAYVQVQEWIQLNMQDL